jgi:hypothetical protein
MTGASGAASSQRRRSWWWAALGAACTLDCLLTTSLDGLEGPPVLPDGGGLDGEALDARDERGVDAAAESHSDAPHDGVYAGDRAIFDAVREGDGARGPFPVADAGGVVRGLTEHGGDLYWVQGDVNTGIVRAPKAGGMVPVFFHMTATAIDVAVDADYVYWSTGKGNEVFRKPVGSTAPGDEVVLFSGAGETLYLAVGSAGRVYATGFDVVVVGPRTDAATSFVHYQEQKGAAGIGLHGTDLFWSVGAGIVRGDETPSPERSVYSGMHGEVAGVATEGDEIFWIATNGDVRAMSLTSPIPVPREVCRASVEIGDAAADAHPDVATTAVILDIAVDDEWVYFGEPALRRISKCAKR